MLYLLSDWFPRVGRIFIRNDFQQKGAPLGANV
jgi:hypothetical protein